MSYTKKSIEGMKSRAVADFRSTKNLMKRLSRLKSQKLDKLIQDLHVSEFERIDCLDCANCCKSISPSVFDSDVRRLAVAMKMKVPEFIDKYLVPDKDDDFVFNATPCPFLGKDNRCAVYTSRPKACRDYPHTDRKRIYQILSLTARNTKICPAVFNIVEQMKRKQQAR